MGNTYVNLTVKGATQEKVKQAIGKRRALMSPMENDCVVVFDEECDSLDDQVIDKLGVNLSKELAAPVLAVMDYDDDVLRYWLFQRGQCVDSYDSAPGYPDAWPPAPPSGGDAEKLCAAFGGTDPATVERILRAPSDDGGFVFGFERHGALVKALGLSEAAVGFGYEEYSQK